MTDNGQIKRSEQLLQYIATLEPFEFLGVTKILLVPLMDNEGEPRQFNDLLIDCLDNFEKLTTQNQKEIFKILRKGKSRKPFKETCREFFTNLSKNK